VLELRRAVYPQCVIPKCGRNALTALGSLVVAAFGSGGIRKLGSSRRSLQALLAEACWAVSSSTSGSRPPLSFSACGQLVLALLPELDIVFEASYASSNHCDM